MVPAGLASIAYMVAAAWPGALENMAIADPTSAGPSLELTHCSPRHDVRASPCCPGWVRGNRGCVRP